MNINKAKKRDRKIQQRKSGMKIDNRNIFILERIKKEKAEEIKRKRKEKEEMFVD